MKAQSNSLSKIFLLFCLPLILMGCSDSSDDEVAIIDPPDPVYTVSDLEVTIVENPQEGMILGTLTTDLPGSLGHSSSNAAFSFEPATLEVFVADPSVFDYELNTEISGTITISNGSESLTATITVTLTDFKDVIESLLTTSKDAYMAAAQGDWIEITSGEFESLENEMEDLTYSGTSVDEYNFSNPSANSLGNSDTSGFMVTNTTDATLVPGSYLFAVKFFTGTGVFGKTKGNLIKVSETGLTEGYESVGNPLPERTSPDRELFFVLKRNNVPTADTSYLAHYMAPKNGIGFKDSSGSAYFSVGNQSEFSGDPLEGKTYAYQGLSTTKIQWD